MRVLVRWEHEGGSEVLEMSQEDAEKAKQLLQEAEGGEWPEEVNDILTRAKKVEIHGTVASFGDGWGWHEEGEEE
jgi:hypothetical protein